MARDRRWRWVVAALMAGLLAAGCGDDEGDGAGTQRVIVSAAASLNAALDSCQDDVDGVDPKLSFGGSDELAAQIRKGVKPDVYLAANTKIPQELEQEGLLGEPVEYATNRLVLAVPADSEISSIGDLGEDGVRIVLGSESVPFGSYTREVLSRLDDAESKAILDNVRSNEPDVRGAVGKLTQGAADASFTYKTDVTATDGELKAIELPAELQPTVVYGGAIVQGAPSPGAAQAYLDSVTRGACAAALAAAGFGPAPSP